MLRGKIKCMTDKINCKGRNKGLREKIKGTRAKEENKRLRREVEGADSANGENRTHEVET